MSAVRVNGGNPGAVISSALESWPLFPAPAGLARDRRVRPLNRSTLLARVSMRSVELSRLYGREAFECEVAGQHWRLRWRYFEGPLVGLELRMRIGAADLVLGIEDPSALGAAIDIARPELPDELRAAYLTALGEPVWPLIEATLGCAVELTAVRINCAMDITSECVSFEIGAVPTGPATRGFLGPVDPNLQHLLFELGKRNGARVPRPMNLPFEWAAVVGSTQLLASELRTLEILDVVLIDDAVFNTEVLECQLAVGADRQRAGRAVLQVGELRMIELTSPGAAFMTNRELDSTRAHDGAFDDVPVVLRFELAQWQAPLSELAQLASGAVIDLGHRIDSQSVAVWAGQRCIGRGQLVAIGERLGVRVLNLAGVERGEAPVASERDPGTHAESGG